jgi:hypothetical protein
VHRSVTAKAISANVVGLVIASGVCAVAECKAGDHGHSERLEVGAVVTLVLAESDRIMADGGLTRHCFLQRGHLRYIHECSLFERLMSDSENRKSY